MKPEDFVHLHTHSTYSLLEGLPSPEEIVLRAKELKQSAVGLADKGYTYGLIEFYQYAKKHGIKPILGLETYQAVRTRHDKEAGTDTTRYPLVLLAETQEGYNNLLELASAAALEGMYYKPRVDDELLEKYGKGLIALTGPISGAVPKAALAEDADRIKELVTKYQQFFGKENFYFELMDLPNVTGQAEVNQQLIHWAKELGVPLVATCNSHYCRPEDAEAHDVLLCIQKNSLVDDPSRFSMRDSDFSMRPFEELEPLFAHVPEALENTKAIADRCEVNFEFGNYRIPRFACPPKKTEADLLTEQAEVGFAKLYPKATPQHRERLEYELNLIKKMGFSGYFLIVADFINAAKEKGIAVGPGRGSAAGSMVSYCIGITALDPIEHGLLFERFLNPERISMPDVDIDFADTRRDEVLEYVRQKYGSDHVVQICTFGTLAARAAVKDVGRAYGVPFMEMNALAKLIPDRPGTTLEEAMATQEMKAAYDSNDTYKKIIDTAFKLEGKARHVSVHACGVIITEEPTGKYTALQRAPKDDSIVITQSSAKPLEALGLLKMDFLGLTNLTVIETTIEIVKRTKQKEVVIGEIPIDDSQTFKLLQKGDTTGVFQLESGGMRRYLKQLKPTTFEDITAMVALYRPGPMEWIPSFIRRKNGTEKIEYLHADLEPILKPTYGIGIYQEQILEIARTFAGYSLGQADILRQAIGKKIKRQLDAQREQFIKGAVNKGYKQRLAEMIFDDVITPFAGYGFNKSHAAGYARLAYETAYLKANFPTEFMSALLSSDAQRSDRVLIEIDECRSMKIEVLPPDINESLRHFTAIPSQTKGEKDSIRFGLTAIKGLGDSSVMDIINARNEGDKFSSVDDMARRIPAKVLNKKTIEALAKSGALDGLGERKTLIENYQLISDFAKAQGDVSGAQGDLFANLETEDTAAIRFPEVTPATNIEKLMWERETLGMYVSNHPLAGLSKFLRKKGTPIDELTRKDIRRKMKLSGLAEGIKKITTKKGDTMAILFLEDPTGKIEVTLFPKIYAEIVRHLEDPNSFYVIEGTLEIRGDELQLLANNIKVLQLEKLIEKAKTEGFYDEKEAASGIVITKKTVPKEDEPTKATKKEPAVNSTDIQRYTIALPDRAPKQLLMDIKSVLENFPGSEQVQLQIGTQKVALPVTVATSTILEKKIAEVLAKHKVASTQ